MEKKKKKTLKTSSKQKIYPIKKNKNQKLMFLVGLVGSVESHTILRMIPTIFILNILVRWDRKIVRSYDLDRDFDNHACNTLILVGII